MGPVTHMPVNAPIGGYGIFIKNMLNTAGQGILPLSFFRYVCYTENNLTDARKGDPIHDKRTTGNTDEKLSFLRRAHRF